MSEHDKDVSASVLLWLVNKVKIESSASSDQDNTVSCKLNDFSSWETYQMIQAADSEDRI